MDFNQNEHDKGVFINGKKQIIDMLRFMDRTERDKLLGNIAQRNVSIARELSEQSLSFKDILKMEDETLSIILKNVSSAVLGLALYQTPTAFQRRALSIINRSQAEAAFNILTQDLSSKSRECQRAQQKIVDAVIELSRRGLMKI